MIEAFLKRLLSVLFLGSSFLAPLSPRACVVDRSGHLVRRP